MIFGFFKQKPAKANTPASRSEADAIREKIAKAVIALKLATEDVADLKYQITIAAGRAYRTGIRADKNWFYGAHRTLRKKKALQQELQHDIGALNAQLKALRHSPDEQGRDPFLVAFIKNAKATLPSETYIQLVEKSRADVEAAEQ